MGTIVRVVSMSRFGAAWAVAAIAFGGVTLATTMAVAGECTDKPLHTLCTTLDVPTPGNADPACYAKECAGGFCNPVYLDAQCTPPGAFDPNCQKGKCNAFTCNAVAINEGLDCPGPKPPCTEKNTCQGGACTPVPSVVGTKCGEGCVDCDGNFHCTHPKAQGASCGAGCKNCINGDCKSPDAASCGGPCTDPAGGKCKSFSGECTCVSADAIAINDPHLLTRDGLLYDFQAAGDFILVNTDTKFAVQARQAPMPSYPGVGWTTAVAVQLGDHRINVIADPLRVSIDGVPTTLDYDVTLVLSGGDSLIRTGSTLLVKGATGDTVKITSMKYPAHLNIRVGVNSYPNHGILGDSADGDPTNDLVIRNGPALSSPYQYEDIYGEFAKSWRVQPEESLFDDNLPPALPPSAPGPTLHPGCATDGKGHEAHNPEWKFHQAGRCEDGDGFTLPDAVTACGGDVRYLSYICSDFPANPPGQPTDERVWTAYYECCSTQSDTGGAGGASTGTGGTGAGTGGLALPPSTGFSVPTSVFTLADLPAVDRDEGARICASMGITNQGLLDACTMDVAVTGNPELAQVFVDMRAPSLVVAAPLRKINKASDAPADPQGCSVGRTGGAASWVWLLAMSGAAYRLRIARRKARPEQGTSDGLR